MDTSEVLQQFVGVTGADTDFALSFLEDNGWDLEHCINLYLEGNAGASGSAGTPGVERPRPKRLPASGDEPQSLGGFLNEQGGGTSLGSMSADEEIARAMSDIPPEMLDAMSDDDGGVRAPIMPKSEVLVGDDPYYRQQLRRRPPSLRTGIEPPQNVFEMFRDLNRESRVHPSSRAPPDQNNKKLKTLAEIFKPPLDLIEAGTFEDVKNIAERRKKWLLVNIQDVAEFDCQKMNRDTWSDPGVKAVVSANFVLWQVLKTSEDGARYCRFYPVEIYPHVAIVDSRTGERLDVWEGFIEPTALIVLLEKFVQTHSLDDNKPKQPRAESPKKLGDLSEEAQLAAAIAASLGKDELDAAAAANRTPAITSTTTTTAAPPPEPASTTTTVPSTTTTSTQPAPTPTPTTPAPEVETKKEPAPVVQEARPTHLLAEHANPSPECTCVLQIRMPSTQIKGHFRPTDTLRTVHQYVSLHLERDTNFCLVVNFPRRIFSGDQLNTTLKQAELVPRAALICELS